MAVMKGPVAAPVSGSTSAPAAVSSLSCDWASSASLVAQIQAEKLIVPDVVAQCANVCQVAFNSTSAPGVSSSRILHLFYIANALIRHWQVKGYVTITFGSVLTGLLLIPT
jgi:hypothetical protein